MLNRLSNRNHEWYKLNGSPYLFPHVLSVSRFFLLYHWDPSWLHSSSYDQNATARWGAFFPHLISLQIIIIDSLLHDSQLSKTIWTLSLAFLSPLLVGIKKSNKSLFPDPSHPQPWTTAIFWLGRKADFRNLEICSLPIFLFTWEIINT